MNKLKASFIYILNKKYFLLLFSFLLFLAFPRETEGFALDLAQKQLAALSEITGPLMTSFIFSFIVFLLGYAFLAISSSFLEAVIEATPSATVVLGEEAQLISIAWGFVAGIANLLLIIAFVVIAFAVILGIEKFQIKKSIPTLLIVALLINFTLLFVGMAIDVSNFFFNAIWQQFDGSLSGSLTPLFNLIEGQTNQIIKLLVGFVAKLLVPYVGVAMQVVWVYMFITALLPFMIQMLVYGVVMLMLSSVFFLFFAVFLARIFILQILAILSPLAFLCLIFPQTKKVWDQWLNTLVEWLFVGVYFIFLMYLGISFPPLISGNISDSFIQDFPMWLRWMTPSFIEHLVLLVYFIVIIFAARKIVPATASAAISQVSGIAKMATPYAGAIAKGGLRNLRKSTLSRDASRKEYSERLPSPNPNLRERISRGYNTMENTMGGVQSWAVSRGHLLAGTSVKREFTKDLDEDVKKIEGQFGDDINSAQEAFNIKPKIATTESEKVAQAVYLAQKKGHKGMSKMDKEDLYHSLEMLVNSDSSHLKTLAKFDPSILVDKKIGNRIRKSLFPDAKDIKDARRKLASFVTDKDIPNMSDDAFTGEKGNEDWQKALIRQKSTNFFRAAGEEKGYHILKKIDEVAAKLPKEEVNPDLIAKARSSAAGSEIFAELSNKYSRP